MAYGSYDSFEAVKGRLDDIVDAVSDENLPLDDALSLYEEAVALGLRASDLLEQGIDEESIARALSQADDDVQSGDDREGDSDAQPAAAGEAQHESR